MREVVLGSESRRVGSALHQLQHLKDQALHLTWTAQKSWPWRWRLQESHTQGYKQWRRDSLAPCCCGGLRRVAFLPSPIPSYLWHVGELGPGLWDLENFAYPFHIGCNNQESGPCFSPGQQVRAGPICGVTSKLALRIWEQDRGFVCVCGGEVNQLRYLSGPYPGILISPPLHLPHQWIAGLYRGWSFRSKAVWSPWHRAQHNIREESQWVSRIDNGTEAKDFVTATTHCNEHLQEMWTKGCTVGHTTTYYSFHQEIFFPFCY